MCLRMDIYTCVLVGMRSEEDTGPAEVELQVVGNFLTLILGTESGLWKSNKPSLNLTGPTSCFL